MIGVDAADRGLLLGDGLFETLLVKAGELVLFDAHAARMRAGARTLGLPAPDTESLKAAAAAAAEPLNGGRGAVRLTWTAGGGGRGLNRPDVLTPVLVATAAAAPRVNLPATLHLSAIRRNAASPASSLKTLSYLDNVMARAEARDAGADEALMLDTEGRLACAAAANLFWVSQGRLYTPALSCGVLPGVMRAQILERAPGLGLPVIEVAAPAGALEAAEAVFLTNSLIGVQAVGRLGHRRWGAHAATDALAASVVEVS